MADTACSPHPFSWGAADRSSSGFLPQSHGTAAHLNAALLKTHATLEQQKRTITNYNADLAEREKRWLAEKKDLEEQLQQMRVQLQDTKRWAQDQVQSLTVRALKAEANAEQLHHSRLLEAKHSGALIEKLKIKADTLDKTRLELEDDLGHTREELCASNSRLPLIPSLEERVAGLQLQLAAGRRQTQVAMEALAAERDEVKNSHTGYIIEIDRLTKTVAHVKSENKKLREQVFILEAENEQLRLASKPQGEKGRPDAELSKMQSFSRRQLSRKGSSRTGLTIRTHSLLSSPPLSPSMGQ